MKSNKNIYCLISLVVCVVLWLSAPFVAINILTFGDQPTALQLVMDDVSYIGNLTSTFAFWAALASFVGIIICLVSTIINANTAICVSAIVSECFLLFTLLYAIILFGIKGIFEIFGVGFWGIFVLLLVVIIVNILRPNPGIMGKYIGKRLLRSVLTLFIIMIVVFYLLSLMPVSEIFDNFDKLPESAKQAKLKSLGLDKSVPERIIMFVKNLFKGDLGQSMRIQPNVDITEILAPRIPLSFTLGGLSMLLSLLLGIPMGVLMAKSKGRFFDKFGTILIVIVQAVPAVVYHILIQFYGTDAAGISLVYRESNPWYWWILPIFSMSLGNIIYYAMWVRRYMIDEFNKDYVKLARAKGASESRIMFSHVLKNAFVPMAQYLPTSFLNTIIGSLYIESLYGINGMGGLLVNAVQRSDYTLVQVLVLLFAAVGILGLILGDLLMVILDPRISFGKKAGDR